MGNEYGKQLRGFMDDFLVKYKREEAVKLLPTVVLDFYKDEKIAENWTVEVNGKMVGYLHNCDGIGGDMGEYTETPLFDMVCNMAKEDLAERILLGLKE